ncbi:regulator of Ty1 Transposition [Coniosporium apollinis]|uniref:Regulator of Ty1 Transposition n=1 Tax=Coniosporium apollinis TaxID=61459 RepID=A0ABQ9P711_9PEZI|nr:regulator of Ty1 Transposition [Coniosporium apollinis]
MATDVADGEPTSSNQPLFYGIAFTIIPSPTLTQHHATELGRKLEANGATFIPLDPETGRIQNLTLLSHIVSTTSDFPDYHSAFDKFVHVVKPSWVDTCILRHKLANPRQFGPDPTLFLSDVTVTCADLPEGDKEGIAGAVIAMGGQYSPALSKMVTHVVALTMDNEKCEVALKKRLRCKIVLPHWFDDCLKLGRRIPEDPYLLPNPLILSNKDVPHKIPSNRDVQGATSPVPQVWPPVSVPPRVLDVFKGKKIMFSADLEMGQHLYDTLEEIVDYGGGELINLIDEADTYICNWREGQDYVKASQAGKAVGNVTWLYYLITHNAWTSPMRRLLHYPLPRGGIPGFENFKISLSNYTGEARIYLENLVRATGAEFTKTMKQDNTHLITAHLASEKCEAAKDWGISLVNHLWLEESYAKCKLQPLTNPRYSHFPPRTNLGEVIGQTQLDREAVERLFFPPNPMQPTPSSGAPPKTNGAVSSAPAVPASSTEVPAQPTTDAAREEPNDDAADRPTPLATRAKRARGDSDIRTPAAIRKLDGKENETPTSTGSRGAKDRALSKLHDAAADIAVYERERKRVGGVVYGKERASGSPAVDDKTKAKEAASRKRTRDEDQEAEEDEEDSVAEQASKKAKKGRGAKNVPPIQYRLMLSGDDRWVDKPGKESADKAKLRDLGISITQSPTEVTLLCAPRLIRTRKFVAALAAAPTVVSSGFLDSCLRWGRIPDPATFKLVDRETEDRLGIKLDEALERAKQNRRQLLKGWQIFCTETIGGGFDTFKDIIAANGGTCVPWKGRASGTARRRVSDEKDETSGDQENEEAEALYLLSGTTPQEKKTWDAFKTMATKQGMLPRIVRQDWILYVAMAQQVVWDEQYEQEE